MSDLIERRSAINAIKELCLHYTPTKSVNHPHIDFVVEKLEGLPSTCINNSSRTPSTGYQPEISRPKSIWDEKPVRCPICGKKPKIYDYNCTVIIQCKDHWWSKDCHHCVWGAGITLDAARRDAIRIWNEDAKRITKGIECIMRTNNSIDTVYLPKDKDYKREQLTQILDGGRNIEFI